MPLTYRTLGKRDLLNLAGLDYHTQHSLSSNSNEKQINPIMSNEKALHYYLVGMNCTFKIRPVKSIQLAPIRMALSFSSISQPRLHQFQLSLWPSCRGGPEDSKTPPTCKVWIILSQVIALPKKQCFEINEDLLVF